MMQTLLTIHAYTALCVFVGIVGALVFERLQKHSQDPCWTWKATFRFSGSLIAVLCGSVIIAVFWPVPLGIHLSERIAHE